MSVPRIIRLRNKRTVCSRKNLVRIKPEKPVESENTNFVKLGLLNIRSLAPKALIINEIITENNLNALCLTETWLKQNDYISLNEATPPGFLYKHEARQTGRGGGVASIFSDFLNIKQRNGLMFSSFEVLSLNVQLPDTIQKPMLSLALITIYRPPGPYVKFLKEFSDFISDLLVKTDKMLIVGDFNIHIDDANDTLGLAFMDLIHSLGIKQNVVGPTHRLKHTLDLILSYGIEVIDVDIIPQSDDITDHYLLLYKLCLPEISKPAPILRPSRTIVPSTKDEFINNLPDLSLFRNAPANSNDLDVVTSSMDAIFTSTLNTVAPIKLKKAREIKTIPWYNSHTRALKTATRALERKWKKTNLEVFRIAYKDSMSSYRRALKSARTEHLRKLIENNHNNPRFLFNTISKLANNRSSLEQTTPPQISSDDFMNFFSNKIEGFRQKIGDAKLSAPAYTPNPVNISLNHNNNLHCFKIIEHEELVKIINSSKPATCMLDSIPTKLLKELLPAIGEPLLNIINSSLSIGHVPNSYKLAVIKPIIKKPQLDTNNLANYRPISNLPFMSKILEKVVSTQLCSFLQTNNIFEVFQSGFRAHHSTETALVKITNDLLLAADRGCVSLLVLLDLSAAFDTIDHNILINRLKSTGVQGQALQWFKSYLTDRYQFVNLNGQPSQICPVKYGVPQGSVLGPLLFTIYMLPMGDIIRRHGISFHCYADDTQLYISTKPDETSELSKLTECIKDIKDWMTNNFLLLNSDKTELLLIGPKSCTQQISQLNLQLEGYKVSFSSTIKDLGVILDSNLTFKNHISHVTKTAFFHLRNIAKLRNMLSISDAEKLVHAFMTSRLDYCNALFAGCPASSINKLQLVQNAAARVLTRSRKYDHITPILSSLHWLPVKFRIEFKILLLTYKALNNLAPVYLTNLLSRYEPTRSLRSQNSGLLVVPRIAKSSKGGRAFSFMAPTLWNSLPGNVRGSDTLSQFKTRLKTYLFSKAYTQCIT